jgi:F0F1-type ATP synthase membrane subunit c/vacuolar-type H+-ATPase subunit K
VAGRKETRKQVTMHISRRAAAIGAAVVIGLAALGAAGAAFAAAATPSAHNRVQVLQLHT